MNKVIETQKETLQHISNVSAFMRGIINELIARMATHDHTKMVPPEVDYFVDVTAKLATSTYGSEEYAKFLEELKPALDHHYARNRHHPEHFKNGINDMNLVDLIELFCDWKSATLRHNSGNLRKSLEVNAARFGMSDQLVKIFENSFPLVE